MVPEKGGCEFFFLFEKTRNRERKSFSMERGSRNASFGVFDLLERGSRHSFPESDEVPRPREHERSVGLVRERRLQLKHELNVIDSRQVA